MKLGSLERRCLEVEFPILPSRIQELRKERLAEKVLRFVLWYLVHEMISLNLGLWGALLIINKRNKYIL